MHRAARAAVITITLAIGLFLWALGGAIGLATVLALLAIFGSVGVGLWWATRDLVERR